MTSVQHPVGVLAAASLAGWSSLRLRWSVRLEHGGPCNVGCLAHPDASGACGQPPQLTNHMMQTVRELAVAGQQLLLPVCCSLSTQDSVYGYNSNISDFPMTYEAREGRCKITKTQTPFKLLASLHQYPPRLIPQVVLNVTATHSQHPASCSCPLQQCAH